MWIDRAYRVLLRPCQGRWPHLLQIEMFKHDDWTKVTCVNCGAHADRLTGKQARQIYEQNDARIAAVERDRSAAAGQLQPADAAAPREGSRKPPVAGAPASGGVPMASNEERE